MKILKNTILAVLLLIFAGVGSFFVITKGLEKTLLETSFYKKVIENTDISSQVMEGVLGEIRGQTPEAPDQLSAKQKQNLNNAIEDSFSRAFDEEWMEETTLMIIDDALSYLKGEQEQLTAVIDLTEKKEVIKNELEKEIEKNIQAPERFEGRMTPQMKQELENQKATVKNQLMSNFPNEIALADLLEKHPKSEQIKAGVKTFQWGYGYLNIIFYSVLIVLALVMLLLGGIKDGLKWVGSGMILASAAVAAFLFGGEQYISSMVEKASEGLTWGELKPLAGPVFNKTYIFASIYAAVGIVLLVAGVFMGKNKAKS